MTTTRYGLGETYGTIGLTYGISTFYHPRLTWSFEVDWDNDGFFDGQNEASMIYSIETYNGRQNFLRGTGDGFEPVEAGGVVIHLRNNDGRYDPYNVSSPLYGNILPGRRYRLNVYDEVNQVLQPVMVGRLDDIRPIYGETDNVRIIASNGVKQMEGKIRTIVYEAIRYDDALEVLLADWENGTDIDTTVSEAMTYWWASNNSLFDEINDVVNAALGMFCIAEDGKATYKSRVGSDVPIVSIDGSNINLEYGVQSPLLWEVVKNKIRVYARTRLTQTDVELWRMSDVLQIAAGATKTIWADFSLNEEQGVALVVTTPVATTDYTAFQNANGTGTNFTSNVSIIITKFSTSAKMEITNIGASAFYLTLLKIRGNALVADKYTFVEELDQPSIDEFGEFEFIVKTNWLQDLNTAQDEADILISRLSSARQFPRVKLNPNPEIQFALRVFGLTSFNVTSKNISGEFRIGYYRHRSMDETLQTFETELYLEPNLLGNVSGTWVFPAVFGTTTVF